MAKVAVRVADITVYYDSTPALKGATIEVEEGSFTGVVGPNGSGKTTLLKAVAKLLEPSSGAVYVDGRSLREYSRLELARRLALVPQEHPEGFNLTVADLVLAGRYPYSPGCWWESWEDEREAMRALDELRLVELSRRRLSELSGGERQRAYLARALAQKPKVLLVDEPLAHLDLRYQVEVMKLLRKLADSGVTVIAATHEVSLAASYCSKLIVLHEGKVAAAGKPREILTPELIKEVYWIEADIIELPGGQIVIAPKL